MYYAPVFNDKDYVKCLKAYSTQTNSFNTTVTREEIYRILNPMVETMMAVSGNPVNLTEMPDCRLYVLLRGLLLHGKDTTNINICCDDKDNSLCK